MNPYGVNPYGSCKFLGCPGQYEGHRERGVSSSSLDTGTVTLRDAMKMERSIVMGVVRVS